MESKNIVEQYGGGGVAGNNHPLNQALILKLILEHVGKVNVADLKNCRLVSHSWNRVAIQVLEHQHRYALEIDYKKMVEFKLLLWNAKLSRIHGHGEERQEDQGFPSLRLSLKVGGNKCADQQQEGFSEVAEAAQLIINNPHLRVGLVSFTYMAVQAQMGAENQPSPHRAPATTRILLNHELFSFLSLTSDTLSAIALNINHPILVPPVVEEFDFTSYLALNFPKLTSIALSVEKTGGGNALLEGQEGGENRAVLLDLTKHTSYIVKNAPKLVELKLDLVLEEITSDSFRAMLYNCAPCLENLSIIELIEGATTPTTTGRKLLSVLSTIKFPKLRTFILAGGAAYFSKEFAAFIAQSCPILQDLQIRLKWCDRNLLANERLNLNFSALPQITHFGASVIAEGRFWFSFTLLYARALFSRLMPKLTSLHSMSIDVNSIFALGAEFQITSGINDDLIYPPPDKYHTFPAITTMTAHIRPSSLNLFYLVKQTTTSTIYHYTFPSLRKLILCPIAKEELDPFSTATQGQQRRDQQRRRDIDFEEYVVRAAEFFCNHPGIQELEIQNYTQNWFEKILDTNQHCLQGLKILKLYGPTKARVGGDGGQPQQGPPPGPRIKIIDLLLRLPALEHLQFGNEKVWAKEVQTIRSVISRFEDPISM